MQAALAQQPRAASGNRQPDVDRAQAGNPKKGEGDQRHQRSTASQATSHLHLVLSISETGEYEVLSAAEVPGEAQLTDEPTGDFIYEVTRNNEVLAVLAVADPFELRSFPGPEGTPRQGHHLERARTARIVVKAPKTDLTREKVSGLEVRFYKLKPGYRIEKVNPAVLQQLKQENKLEMKINLTPNRLTPQILEKGRKVSDQ